MTTGNCIVCGIPTRKSCSSCKSVFYCNEGHQKKDWRSHKEYCLKIKAAGANTFDAILFAVNETTPRLIKVPWEMHGVMEPFHMLNHGIWFKQPFSEVRSLYVHRWGVNGPKLQHTLCLEYDDNFLGNGSPVNRCIEAVTGGRAGLQWCGNVLALRKGSSYDFFESVNMQEDLKSLVRFLEEHEKVMPLTIDY